jgi:lysophospholipid acyltransferase (LPLAT)-like uncharacterized protein
MKLRNPHLIKLAGWLGAGALRAWSSTLRCLFDTQGQHIEPWDPALQERYIYALWHESLLFLTTLRSVADVTALISRHADGELLAQVCRWFGVYTVRGSSGRGGVDAMEELLRLGKRTHLLVAPDGPLGPRRQVKRGLIYLASWTGISIVPLGVGFHRAWRLNSWDRMALPKPWSTVTCVVGPIIRVPSAINRADSDHYRQLVEQNMAIATSAAEAWAVGEKPAITWPAPLKS